MQDLHTMLSTLSRPRLLISAARHGLHDYDRKKHLSKLLGTAQFMSPAEAALRLVEIEKPLNEARVSGEGNYSISRHVDVLIALMGEAALLENNRQSPARAT